MEIVPAHALPGGDLAGSQTGSTGVSGRRARLPGSVLAISVVFAAALEIGLRMTPSYDPFGWLVWGRQTVHLALDPAGAPSWKPLPWLLTTPLALVGGAAPTLWLIVACAAGLWALWLAYRLGHRLAGPVGGAVAVGGIVLCRNWLTYMLTGNVEPATAALALGAVESHLLGRRRLAFVLLALAALMRPECGFVLVVYGAWLWRSDRGARALEAAFAVALPLLWFVPPYLAIGAHFGSHDPVFVSGEGTRDPLTVVHRAGAIVIWPVAIAALVGLALAVRRQPAERGLAIAIAAGSAGWVATTALMAAAGFPGLERFMMPAAAGGCVLAGAGVGWAATAVRGVIRPARWPLGLAALLLAATPTVWYAQLRARSAVSSIRDEQARSTLERSLQTAIAAAGGRRRLLACGLPSADVGFQSALGWDLHTAVGQVLFRPKRDVNLPDPVVLLATRQQARLGEGGVLLAHSGPWSVIAIRPRAGCTATTSRVAQGVPRKNRRNETRF
ncbi:MAG: hypothetical protein ACXVTC_24380 [Solirubrobacteraceae bacterium]